jgi:hypothetical protein
MVLVLPDHSRIVLIEGMLLLIGKKHRDGHGKKPATDDPIKVRRHCAEHRLEGERDKETEKRRPTKSSTQDVSYPYQHAGGKEGREQMVKSDAEFPGSGLTRSIIENANPCRAKWLG